MADILTTLAQFLCYGSSQCVQLFQSYSYKPMEGIFYAVFFPILFILLFVYIISGAVGTLKGAKGFRILISVAVFAFIIFQGWYYFFALVSQFWLFILVLLGVFWMILHTFTGQSRGSDGGAPGKGRTGGSMGGFGGKALGRVWDKAVGTEKTEADLIRAKINRLAQTKPGGHGVDKMMGDIAEELRAFGERTSVAGLPVASEAPKLLKEFDNACKKHHEDVPEDVKKTIEDMK